MPSGAKKRKAAKKKLQKEAHNTNSNDKDVSNIQGTDNAKTHDERESDGVNNNHEEGDKEVRLGDENVGEYSKEVKSDEYFNDVNVNAEDDFRGSKNGKHKSSSSSSSSSEDDEVPIEKGEVSTEKVKPVVAEAGEVEHQVSSSFPEVSRDTPVISEVYNLIEEKIPFEESVKQVVSMPQEAISGSESVAVDNSTTSHVVDSGLKQKLDDEKDKVSSGVTDFVQEKIETKVIQVVDEGPGNVSESVDNTARDGEGLPESCDVRSADACCEDNHVNESETHKYVEEQPLISSAPLPVRRTSLMNCCGLFEVFSGGANR